MTEQENSLDSDLPILKDICRDKPGLNRHVLEQVIILAMELAREGREGRKVDTMFIVGDSQAVLERSRALILDPLWHHDEARKHIDDHNLRETLKELSPLDGAFIISEDRLALSACRYINASAQDIKLPLGLGSRHMAAASISAVTDAVAVVVSESSVVRIFDQGEIVAEIIPELWLLRRHGLHLSGPYSLQREGEMTVVSKSS